MATYVISDIHGQYDMFMELLEKIPLKDSDTLYILGDVVDRGPHPIKTLQKLKKMPNVICMVGNHELMALRCLKLLMTADAQSVLDSMKKIGRIFGCGNTTEGCQRLKSLENWMQKNSRKSLSS